MPSIPHENTAALLTFYDEIGVVKAERTCLKAEFMTQTELVMWAEDQFYGAGDELLAQWQAAYALRSNSQHWQAILASAEGEQAAWRARGTPLPGT